MDRKVIDVEKKAGTSGQSLRMLRGHGDIVFDSLLYFFFAIFCLTTLYPFLNVLVKSFSNGRAIIGKFVGLIPIEPTFDNYKVIFSDTTLLRAMFISFARTVIGTLSTLLVLFLAGYAMSKRHLRGRAFIMVFLLIPMYFGSGLIPAYVNIVRLGLFNKFLVYILPGLFSGFNFLLIMSYITQIPSSYEESAMIDGASYPYIAARIMVPLCAPVLATIALFCAVGQWNSWFDALMYVNRYDLQPLQSVLQTIIKESSLENIVKKAQYSSASIDELLNSFTPETIQCATMIFTILPILIVYPYLQRYFVTGITLGGIKG
jgi:putative aldouronate transport system permease protein